MKKLSALFLVITLMMSVSFLAGCESKTKKEEFETTKYSLEQTQEELDKIKQNSEALDKYIANLKSFINDLRIENQKLIAGSKRLEAEIIDLNLELGKIPDSGKDLSKDDKASSDSSEKTETAPSKNDSNSDDTETNGSKTSDNTEHEV
jgi:septal ring factor EnvC (AmiA/AmiB activator)